jgi:hypothetical protein
MCPSLEQRRCWHGSLLQVANPQGLWLGNDTHPICADGVAQISEPSEGYKGMYRGRDSMDEIPRRDGSQGAIVDKYPE